MVISFYITFFISLGRKLFFLDVTTYVYRVNLDIRVSKHICAQHFMLREYTNRKAL